MLSIKAMGAGQERYYLNLAREDYYLEGGEPPGRWWGRGAEHLDLGEQVGREQLSKLFQGFDVHGEKLVQNAGKDNRQAGWDLTFSAPKSVSVLWSQTDEATRRIIQDAHHAAVQAALAYVQEDATFSRVGKGGQARVQAGLVVATFEHGTSRALDPQLHTHALVLNVATRPDGTTGTVLSRPFYQHKMTAGAIYRVQLAYELENRLGLLCLREKNEFAVAGVPRELAKEFSKRRAEIERVLEANNMQSAAAAAAATLSTREVKKLVPPRSELFRNCQTVGREHGFGPDEAKHLLQRPKRIARDHTETFAQALNEGIHRLTETQSHFAERELLRETAQAVQGTGMDAATVRELTHKVLTATSTFVALGHSRGEKRYTTREMLDLEARLLQDVRSSKHNHQHMLDSKQVDSVLDKFSAPRSALIEEAKYHASQIARSAAGKRTKSIDRHRIIGNTKLTLSDEQKQAVRHVTQREGSIAVLAGMAGTGKTITLRACREVWEQAGYRVYGAALAGKAARELEKGSGIQSFSIRTIELFLDPSLKHQLKEHGKQLLRAAAGMQTFRPKPLVIEKNTVLVIDEAGMVGTRQMARLVEAVTKGGGKLVLVGDARQLQPIEAGGPFAAIAKETGQALLTRITRQKDHKDRQVVHDAADGKAHEALKSLAERNLLAVESSRAKALDKLVSDWADREAKAPEKSLIFCGRNEEAADLNRRCQEERIRAGLLDQKHRIRLGEDGHVCVGDRVQLLRNSTKLDVRNGDIATVIGVNPARKTITVRQDDGARIVIPLKKYTIQDGEHRGEVAVKLGYAVTSHKGQGTTVDRAYVLIGGSMQDREISYVQLSRSRQETRCYTDRFEAGEELSNLAKQMSLSRKKDLAHDVLEEQRRQEPQTLALRYVR